MFVFAHGERVAGRIAIAMPEATPDGDSVCTVDIDGLTHGPRVIFGESTLQALCLAMRFAGFLLHDFRRRGGRVLGPDGEELALHALFGPLLCAPPPAADDSASDT